MPEAPGSVCGLGNLGIHILYSLLNRLPHVWAERVYAPAPDMEALLRSEGLPLFALESRDSLDEFDGIGFTLQSEGGAFGNNYVYDRGSVNDGKLHFTIANCDGKKWRYFTDGADPASTGALGVGKGGIEGKNR